MLRKPALAGTVHNCGTGRNSVEAVSKRAVAIDAVAAPADDTHHAVVSAPAAAKHAAVAFADVRHRAVDVQPAIAEPAADVPATAEPAAVDVGPAAVDVAPATAVLAADAGPAAAVDAAPAIAVLAVDAELATVAELVVVVPVRPDVDRRHRPTDFRRRVAPDRRHRRPVPEEDLLDDRRHLRRRGPDRPRVLYLERTTNLPKELLATEPKIVVLKIILISYRSSLGRNRECAVV